MFCYANMGIMMVCGSVMLKGHCIFSYYFLMLKWVTYCSAVMLKKHWNDMLFYHIQYPLKPYTVRHTVGPFRKDYWGVEAFWLSLATSECPPLRISRIWVPPSKVWQNLGTPPPTYMYITLNNTSIHVLWPYLSYFDNYFWRLAKSGSPPPPMNGEIWVTPLKASIPQ